MIRLFVLAMALAGCSSYIEAEAPNHETITVTRPCGAILMAPSASIADESGHCDMAPYDGEVGNQFFELFSNSHGVPVRASVSRNAPQNLPIEVGKGQANVWNWEHVCDKWLGIVIWSDNIFHDQEFTWISYHDWSLSIDATCKDDGYRIAGTWSGID